jgi:hypothetical protein
MVLWFMSNSSLLQRSKRPTVGTVPESLRCVRFWDPELPDNGSDAGARPSLNFGLSDFRVVSAPPRRP